MGLNTKNYKNTNTQLSFNILQIKSLQKLIFFIKKFIVIASSNIKSLIIKKIYGYKWNKKSI